MLHSSSKRPNSSHNYFHGRNHSRGVLKFSAIEGEYDLIPAVGENRPAPKSDASRYASAYGRSRSMHTLHDKGVINIRPVTKQINPEENATTIRSAPISRSKSTDNGLFSTEPLLFRTSNLIKSRRKTPITSGREIHYTSECKHCGKSTQLRRLIV